MQGGATIEQINCGSLQRIADAAEKMALRHTELIAEFDTMGKKLSAAKGQITKLKKKMAEINAAFEAVKETT